MYIKKTDFLISIHQDSLYFLEKIYLIKKGGYSSRHLEMSWREQSLATFTSHLVLSVIAIMDSA